MCENRPYRAELGVAIPIIRKLLPYSVAQTTTGGTGKDRSSKVGQESWTMGS